MVSLKFCECGCGKRIKSGRRFISGHNSRIISNATKLEVRRKMSKSHGGTGILIEEVKARLCECGCGESAKPRNRFINGHNGRKPNPPKEPCKCGCGELANPGYRFINGHWQKKKSRPLPVLCECGCGDLAKPGNRFLHGHTFKGQTKENNPAVAAAARKKKGRTKYNHSGVASMAKKMTQRTKENCPGFAASIEARSGPNHYNWQGGISAEPYCTVWLDEEYKESIKERDGYRCLNPGCWKTSSRLCVHHIDYNKKHCHPWHLATVCFSCNCRANFNRGYWQELYQTILTEKYGYQY